MSTAVKGRTFEHYTRNVWEREGFDVIRGAASKGGVFGFKTDLLATLLELDEVTELNVVKQTDQTEYKLYMILIQCKAKKRR